MENEEFKLFHEYIELDQKIKDLEQRVKDFKSSRVKKQHEVISFIQNKDLEKLSIGGKTFSVRPYLIAKVTDESTFFNHLVDTGNGSLIKRSVPWQTLRSYCDEIIVEGKEQPDGVEVSFIDKLYMRKSN